MGMSTDLFNKKLTTPNLSDLTETLETPVEEWKEIFSNFISLFSSTIDNQPIKTETQFFNNSGRPTIVHSQRMDGLNFQTSHVFMQNNSGRYGILKKLHIQKHGLKNLKMILKKKDFQFIENFFTKTTAEMDRIEKYLFNFEKFNINPGHHQLLLISYSDSSGSFDAELSQLSDQVFGEPYQDETLFSLHFGESSPGLEIFDPYSCTWKKNDWRRQPVTVLLGQEVRALLKNPTSYRIFSEPYDKSRFSLILEKIGVIPETQWKTRSPQVLLRRTHSAQRQKSTAIIVCDQGPIVDKGWIQLIQQQINTHLFYYRRLSQLPIFFVSKLLAENNLESLKDAEQAVFIEPYFFLKSEHELNCLFSRAQDSPDLIYFYFEDHLNLASMTLMNLKVGRSMLKQTLLNGPCIVRSQYPNSRIDELNPIFSFNFSDKATFESIQKTCQSEDSELQNFLKNGFAKTFIFNTEPYDEVRRLKSDLKPTAIVGLASGFKTFFIAAEQLPENPNIYLADSNQKSLAFWKMVWMTWDGVDFPKWFNSKNFKSEDFYQREQINELWSDELKKWGGQLNFQNKWKDLKRSRASFHHVDFLDIGNFLNQILSSEREVLFWISNVWDNEYTFSRLGEDYLKNLLHMLRLLDQHRGHFRLLGSPIHTQAGSIDINGRDPKILIETIKASKPLISVTF